MLFFLCNFFVQYFWKHFFACRYVTRFSVNRDLQKLQLSNTEVIRHACCPCSLPEKRTSCGRTVWQVCVHGLQLQLHKPPHIVKALWIVPTYSTHKIKRNYIKFTEVENSKRWKNVILDLQISMLNMTFWLSVSWRFFVSALNFSSTGHHWSSFSQLTTNLITTFFHGCKFRSVYLFRTQKNIDFV